MIRRHRMALARALIASATLPLFTTAIAQPAAPVLAHTAVLSKLESQAGGTVVKLIGMKDAKGHASNADDLFCEGQAGMAGVAVDPDFASNRFIDVDSTSSSTAPGTNRLMRFKVSDNTTAVTDRTGIVTDIPYEPRASDHPFGGPGARGSNNTPKWPCIGCARTWNSPHRARVYPLSGAPLALARPAIPRIEAL